MYHGKLYRVHLAIRKLRHILYCNVRVLLWHVLFHTSHTTLFGNHFMSYVRQLGPIGHYSISVISCRSVLLFGETGVLGEDYRPVAIHWNKCILESCIEYILPWAVFKLIGLVVIGTACTCRMIPMGSAEVESQSRMDNAKSVVKDLNPFT
jgi:hypothetical protein